MAGATGFVGRRLCPALADLGHDVVALTRHPEQWTGPGRAVGADTDDPDSLAPALDRCDTAYYLVHSLGREDFAEADARAAYAFGAAAQAAGVRRVVYLGGLGDDGDALSAHLRSRRQVEGLLGGAGVPVTVLRAGIVVGHGGISWELTRQLVEHLPAMVTPQWVRTRCQPIAVDDVVRYLTGVLDVDGTFEIGGPDVLTYREMLQRVARIEGRRLPVVSVPLLTPRLSSRWLALVTDVDTATARHLIDSMTNEVVVRDTTVREVVPFEPLGYDEAVRVALQERALARGRS